LGEGKGKGKRLSFGGGWKHNLVLIMPNDKELLLKYRANFRVVIMSRSGRKILASSSLSFLKISRATTIVMVSTVYRPMKMFLIKLHIASYTLRSLF